MNLDGVLYLYSTSLLTADPFSSSCLKDIKVFSEVTDLKEKQNGVV